MHSLSLSRLCHEGFSAGGDGVPETDVGAGETWLPSER